MKYLLCLINSKLLNYWFAFYFHDVNIKPEQIRKLPIKELSPKEQISFVQKADLMLQLNNGFHEKLKNFIKLIKSELNIEKNTKKLETFYRIDFEEFIKELKIKISIDKKEELLEFFERHKRELTELKEKIDITDREIDKMVFDLYGISEEERQIITVNQAKE